MITRREGDHAARSVIAGDSAYVVVGAPELKGAGALKHFGLDQDAGTQQPIERGRLEQWRADGDRGDLLRGIIDGVAR